MAKPSKNKPSAPAPTIKDEPLVDVPAEATEAPVALNFQVESNQVSVMLQFSQKIIGLNMTPKIARGLAYQLLAHANGCLE